MRSFIPFGDPWQLPISTPYSFLVRDRDLAWTCGQIPVGMASEVLAPGNLVGQTRIVCDYIETILQKSSLSAATLGKLVLYYVEHEPGDKERMIACCQARFGERPVLVPVAVPHFYFDGLLLEVDAFAGENSARSVEISSGRSSVQICDGGELSWVCVKTHPDDLEKANLLLEEALTMLEIPTDQRLCEHWIVPKQNHGASHLLDIANNIRLHDLASDEGAVVESTDCEAPLMGELTYVSRADCPTEVVVYDVDGIRIVNRKSGRFYWFSIRSTDVDFSIVMQTQNMMNRLAKALREEGLNFDAIVKSTSYYTGGNSDSELYENMVIRNNRYSIPGPASTGLPVANFASKESLIVVDVIAMNAASDNTTK